MTDLKGRVALVTGGGRGIGSAIALRLAKDGADVVAQIEALGRRARAYACSVDRFEDAARPLVRTPVRAERSRSL